MGERILQAGTADVADAIWFDVAYARQCILNGVVAGAPAEVALKTEWEVFLLLLGKARGCHDHARGAEPALERLRIEERLLHRVKLTVAGQPFDGLTSRPSARNAGTRQLWTGLPSSQTVHAPQSPA